MRSGPHSADDPGFRNVPNDKEKPSCGGMQEGFRGADGNRNHDLFDANEALYQLSYSPVDVAVLRIAT